MRTANLKDLATRYEDDYWEYHSECIEEGNEPQDVWEWLAEQLTTAEEARYEANRDDKLTEE